MPSKSEVRAKIKELDEAVAQLPEGTADPDAVTGLRENVRDLKQHLLRIDEAAAASNTLVIKMEQNITKLEAGIPPPPAPSPDEVPHPGGPTIDIYPENAASRLAEAPERADIVAAPGEYNLINLPVKAGQRWRAPDGATVYGGGSSWFFHNAAVNDVSIIGFAFTQFLPSVSGKRSDGRMHDETGIIHALYDRANGWVLRDLHFHDLGKGAITVAGQWDVRRVKIERVEGAAIAGHAYNATFEDIYGEDINQVVRAASHHHSGLIKLVGGERDKFGGPAREGIVLRNIRGKNINGRGLVWIDWDVMDVLIEDFFCDGCTHEGITYEASKHGVIRNGELKDCCQEFGGGAPEWNTALMLQNSSNCLVENVKIWKSARMDAAIGIAHHYRDKSAPPVGGANVGMTTGRFVGMDNKVNNISVQGDLQPLYQGIAADYPPDHAVVRASNTLVNAKRF